MKRKSMCLLLVAAMILGLLIPQLSITAFAAEDEDPDPVQAVWSDLIVDTVGVNVHFDWTWGVYSNDAANNMDPYKDSLIESGIRYLRFVVGNAPKAENSQGAMNSRKFMEQLYDEAGIKNCFILDHVTGGDTVTPSEVYNYIKKYGLHNYTALFEGGNEVDNAWLGAGGTGWYKNTVDFHMEMYDLLKSDPDTADIPFISPSFIYDPNFTLLTDLVDYIDGASLHSYPWGKLNLPTQNSGRMRDTALQYMGVDKPYYSTEDGYHNAYKTSTGVTEEVDSKYINRLFLDRFLEGYTKTFRYELIDSFPGSYDNTDQEQHFGLLRRDYTPKPAYWTLRNMLSLLKDPGEQFNPGTLDFTLSGNTDKVKSLLMQKRDGTFWLALWVDEVITNNSNATLNPTRNITLNFNEDVSYAKTYLIPTDATPISPVNTYNNPASVDLTVPGEVMLIEISKPLLKNPGFEEDLTGWTVDGPWTLWADEGAKHGGDYSLHLFGAEETSVTQTITGLPDGNYTLSAWHMGWGPGSESLEVTGFGGENMTVSGDETEWEWRKLTLNNIQVTNGKLTVVLKHIPGSAGEWDTQNFFDDIELTLVEAASYSMTASSINSFGVKSVGYTSAPESQNVIITNTGSSNLTLITPVSQYYNLTLSDTILPAGGSVTLTVQPKTGLSVGSYNEKINIESTNNSKTYFYADFNVTDGNFLVNSGFENGLNGWTSGSTSQFDWTSRVIDWAKNSGSYALGFGSDIAYVSSVSQTASGIPNGTYNVSVWVQHAGLGGDNYARLNVSGYGGEDLSVDATGDEWVWQKITIENVEVTNNKMTITLEVADDTNWGINVCFDDVELILDGDGDGGGEVIPPPDGENLLLNPGFEEQYTNWSVGGTAADEHPEWKTWINGPNSDDVHSGEYCVQFGGASEYLTTVSQTVTGIPNGTYKLSVWQRGSFDTGYARLEATEYGGEYRYAEIKTGDWGWVQLVLENIEVTNGQIKVGLTVNGYSWSDGNHFDDAELILVKEAPEIIDGTLINPGFEDGLTAWNSTGDAKLWLSDGESVNGDYRVEFGASEAHTSTIMQTITGLQNGTYKLSVWGMRENGPDGLGSYSRLEAKNYGGEDLYVNLPGHETAGWGYQQIEIDNIQVTNGTLTVSFTVSDQDTSWHFCVIDEFELTLKEVTQPEAEIMITSPELVDFGTVQAGYATAPVKTVTVTNISDEDIKFLHLNPINQYYNIALSSVNLPSGGNITITLSPKTGLSAGNYNNPIAIYTYAKGILNIPVNFTVAANPYASVFVPSPANVSVTAGNSAELNITRSGIGLDFIGEYEIVQIPDGWTTQNDLSFISGSVKDTIIINVPHTCSAGTYNVILRAVSDSETLTECLFKVTVSDDPVKLSFVPAYNNGEWFISAMVENMFPVDLSGTIKIVSPVILEGEGISFELKAEQSDKVLIPVINLGQDLYNITLKAEVDGYKSVSASRSTSFTRAEKVTTPIVIDGILDINEWGNAQEIIIDKSSDTRTGAGAQEIPDWNGTSDLSAKIYTKWDENNLYLGIEVTDDIHFQSANGSDIWSGDSIQFSFDPGRANGVNSSGYNEIGMALTNTGSIERYRWTAANGSGGNINAGLMNTNIARDNTNNTTTYETAISWELLLVPGVTADVNSLFGLSLLVNENDGSGRRGWIQYMDGIGGSKDPGLFGDLLLVVSEEEPITVTKKPYAVQNFDATTTAGEVDTGTITFTWVDPNNEHSAIDMYEIYMTNGGNKWLDTPVIINTTDTTATLTFAELGITKSGDYDFRIKAANAFGTASFVYLGGENRYKLSVVVEVPEPTAKPKLITNFNAVLNGEAITFSWVNPNPEKSATTVETYSLYKTSGGSVWLEEAITINASEVTVDEGITSVTLTFDELGIAKSGNYDFRIKARNSIEAASYVYIGGENRYKVAVEIESLVPIAKPKAVTAFNAVSDGETVTFTWINPNNSATAVEYYELTRTNTGNTWQTPITIDASEVIVDEGITSVTYTLEDLGIDKDGTYDFRIKGINDEGVSALAYLGGGTSSDVNRYRLTVEINVVVAVD